MTALSLRYTDLTAKQYKNGQLAVSIVDSGTGPGSTGVGSFGQLASDPRSKNMENPEGCYAVLPLNTPRAREFTNWAADIVFDRPYLIGMAKLAPIGGGPAPTGRIIVYAILELKSNTQLMEHVPSLSDLSVLEAVDNALIMDDSCLIGDNPTHWERIKNFLKIVAKHAGTTLLGAAGPLGASILESLLAPDKTP